MKFQQWGWLVPVLLVLVTGCFSVSTGAAQTMPAYKWRSVTVGAGGFIPGIVFSRVEPGLAYLRSDMGGAYRWDAAQKTWTPLHDNLAESSYFGTESIAPDPVDANVVYIAAGMYRADPAAILLSRDRGKTWQVFPVSFRMGGNEDGRGLGERLAIDPNQTSTLYFASRHDGLMRSTNYGETWQKVAGFPLAGRGLPGRGAPTNGGLSFVVFDPASGRRGAATPTLFVGSADPGPQHLFRSDDAGQTWKAVAGQPKAEFLPAKAEIDASGVLYITYGNGIGPNGVTDGAVMKIDTHTGQWTDITPDKRPSRPAGGYMGISLDRQHPGTLGVTTMNRWGPVDTVWRTTDGGQTWSDIVGKSERDISATPYLTFGGEAKIGWWMAAFAIDPFDSNFAAYGTGATIFATREFGKISEGKVSHWFPWVEGIEQTAIITLLSPRKGPHLLSGFGDIGGFVHDDLAKSPPGGMYRNPLFGNTNTLDDAEQNPAVIVRSGRPGNNQAPLAWSDDGGHSWQPLLVPTAPPVPGAAPPAAAGGRGRNRQGTPALIVSADGKTFMVMTPTPQITVDRGKTWTAVQGLPPMGRPVADRVNAARFYALDYATGTLYTSRDGGATFAATPTVGLPASISGDRANGAESAWTFVAAPGHEGDLWLVSKEGLFHSTDSGQTFRKTPGTLRAEMISFGKAPAGRDYPALFAIGRDGGTRAIWRSDDQGATWLRLNDEAHQWGTRFRCLAADPQVFGRVYVGTDGRGILYGEPTGR